MNDPAVLDPTSERASLEFISPIEPVGPIQTGLNNLFSAYHDAVRNGDSAAAAKIVPLVDELFAAFTGSHEGGTNPRWRLITLRASWAYCKQDYKASRTLDLEGWAAAEVEPASDGRRKRLSVSANNIGVASRMLGEIDDAVLWCDRALTLWPTHPIWLLNFAVMLGLSGRREECGRLFAVLARAVRLESRTDLLTACLDYETDLAELRGIAEVDELLHELKRSREARGARVD